MTSLILGDKFLSNREIVNVLWDKTIEKYNFGDCFNFQNIELDSFIKKISGCVSGKYADYGEANLQLSEEEKIKDLTMKIKNGNVKRVSAYRFIESYIKLSGKKDEELAELGQNRMRGIEYLRLCKILLPKQLKEIWASIIKAIDAGRATLAVSLNRINQKTFVDSLLFAGEQNFSCNESDLIYFIYPLLEYECSCQNNLSIDERNESDIIKGKSSLINLILSCLPELREKVDEYEIENLKENSILKGGIDYYMSRYPIYENDEKLKRILDITKHYGEG